MRTWHRRFVDALHIPVASRTVATPWGDTHLLTAGPSDAPPLILLHGALASSAAVLHELQGLSAHFHVHAVDIVGQSAMSADRRLPVDDDTVGRWLAAVMDGVGLAAAHVVGVSWGGFVAQRLAAVAPARLLSLTLLVPAGMVTGPWWRGVREMGWPLTRYLMRPSDAARDALLRGLLSTPDDPLWGPFIADAFLCADLRSMRVPRRSRTGEFDGLGCPVHVIGAERDVSFPGDRVVARARQLFPSLASAQVLPGLRHSPPTTDLFRERFCARVIALLRGESTSTAMESWS